VYSSFVGSFFLKNIEVKDVLQEQTFKSVYKILLALSVIFMENMDYKNLVSAAQHFSISQINETDFRLLIMLYDNVQVEDLLKFDMHSKRYILISICF